nr:MAG TPA: hypothetical protein [Caudoviricetes sp.]
MRRKFNEKCRFIFINNRIAWVQLVFCLSIRKKTGQF